MIITLEDAKAHLSVTTAEDDDLITNKIKAAEAWLGLMLGGHGWVSEDDAPEPLKEAARQLVAHLYENREATLVGVNAQPVPLGVHDFILQYRDWEF